MQTRMLVTYGSWAGSTRKIAESIGDTLRKNDVEVDVLPAKAIQDLSPYQSVIIGSAIHAGSLHPDINSLFSKHSKALASIPYSFFIVCLSMKDDTPETRCKVEAYLDKLREQYPAFKPVEIGMFAGLLNYKKIPFPFRLILKAMKAEEGDFTDFELITQWANDTYKKLLPV